MSVIVGLIDNGEIYMAGDSAVAHPNLSWIREDTGPKVWRTGRFLVGVVGKCRVSDIIFEHIDPDRKVTQYEFVDMVRVALGQCGSLKVQSGIETMDAEILLGQDGRLFHIMPDFGLFEPRAKYHAIGAGAPYALGALHVMDGENWVPSTKVSMAVEAAVAFSPYVVGPQRGLRLAKEDAA